MGRAGWKHQLAIPCAAISIALLAGLGLIAITGTSTTRAVAAFAEGAFGSAYAMSASLNRAAVLGLTGLGFLFAFRANLTNVGGEGQIALGGAAATALALYGGASVLPSPLCWLLPIVAGAVAGGAWGGLAGVLKVRFGTNEVISTLMLTFIGTWIVYWLTHSDHLLRQPRTSATSLPESADIPAVTQIPFLPGADPSAPMHWGLPIALLMALLVAVVLLRTPLGVRLRALGLNERAARLMGIATGRIITLALFVAGALSGLAGALMIQGDQYNLKSGFSSGYGFDGLVIGLLARSSVSAVLLYAAFFGFLRSGGISMEISGGVPSAVVVVMQGLIVLVVAAMAWFSERIEASDG